jgi:hypothetical protein
MTPQEWLDSERDYEAGRQLYEQLGDNPRLKQVLGHGPSAYNTEALEWELVKLAQAGVVTSVVTVHVTATAPLPDVDVQQSVPTPRAETSANATNSLQTVPTSAPAGTELPSTAAVLLMQLSQARRPLYDQRTVLHQGLEHHPTEADALVAARHILKLSRELNANWKDDAHVRAHGELPAGPPPAPGLDTLTPAELVKKRANLRSQVSKLKKQPHRADDLAKVQATLAEVEALINPAA